MRFVQLKKRIKFKVNWRGMAAVLVIDIETGFSVVDSSEKVHIYSAAVYIAHVLYTLLAAVPLEATTDDVGKFSR